MTLKNLKLSSVVSFLLILFAAFFLWQSQQYQYWSGYGPGAGFVPSWCNGGLLILAVVAFIQSFKQSGIKVMDLFPSELARKNILISWGALIFFAVFCKILGFTITSILTLYVLFRRGLDKKKSIICSVVVAILAFFLFKSVLMVQVPVNQFGW